MNLAQQIVNGIVPVLVTALGGVLTVIIKNVGDAIVGFIEEKKAKIVAETDAAQYNMTVTMAKGVWGIVDEYFRTNPLITKTIDSAKAKFAEELKKVLPDVTDEDIDHLRQVVAGEVNKGRAVIVAPAEEKNEEPKTETTTTETTTTTEAK